MNTIQIRDNVNNQRMFDLEVNAAGKVIVTVKLPKGKVSTTLEEVLNKAEQLTTSA